MNLLQKTTLLPACMAVLFFGCQPGKNKEQQQNTTATEDFAPEMVKFSPYANNPVFQGSSTASWDVNLRERGYILFENGTYRMWYTGYNDSLSEKRFLGYATSQDGIRWERYSNRPILEDVWVEDMHVIKHENTYYMLAEGKGDIAHLLTSPDGITWESKGNLSISQTNGQPISKGPYGTPTVWIENGKKYLFYERDDMAIWLATSEDFIHWTNVQDEPVLDLGPGEYDEAAVAANQIVKHKGKYYMYYHGSNNPDWMKKGVTALWTSNVAMSTDLKNWKKYPKNPIVEGDHSSPILVNDGKKNYLFTMHDKVWRYEGL